MMVRTNPIAVAFPFSPAATSAATAFPIATAPTTTAPTTTAFLHLQQQVGR
jgi:hypothetical protein